jgi:hypothetical protein
MLVRKAAQGETATGPVPSDEARMHVAGLGHAVHGRTYRTRTQDRPERTLP